MRQRSLPNGKNQARSRSTPIADVYACVLLCGCLVGWRRKWRLSLLLVVILLLPFAGANLTGCGGGGANTGTSTTTSNAMTFNVTLTGTDSVNNSIASSTTFTLTVD
jgi:hypothetical protein